jgi:hypothetical protein
MWALKYTSNSKIELCPRARCDFPQNPRATAKDRPCRWQLRDLRQELALGGIEEGPISLCLVKT